MLIAFAAVLVLLSASAPVQAAPGCEPGATSCPPLLAEFGENGTGPGQLGSPSSIAADPDTGHIFVLEGFNRRISEFDSGGSFVKAWGWGVLDGAAELQVCTAATGCLQGLSGAGAGQINTPAGITLDEAGNVWVAESGGLLRIQKFSQSGDFLLMAGGQVNKTKVAEREQQEANAEPVTVTEAEENLCTAASGDLCGKGVAGSGDGQFTAIVAGSVIDVGPGGTIYVGDIERIQKFNEEGAYEGDIPLAGGEFTRGLTVSPAGRLYVISSGITEKVAGAGNFEIDSLVVREIGPAGEELGRLVGQWEGRKTPKDPVAVATDAEGNVYVVATVVYAVEGGSFKEVREVLAFDAGGELINFEPARAGFGASGDQTSPAGIATNIVGDGSGAPGEVIVGYFFNGIFSGTPSISYVRSYGTPFEEPEGAPTIEDQYATFVTDTAATLEARINPRFTVDTTYQVEYGTGKCSDGGCETVVPTPPAQLGGGAVNLPQKTGPVTLSGLEPATTYHFRFVAQNGKGPADFDGEGTFRTYSNQPPLPCPNDEVRGEFGMLLPDCRAYEMVSPVDKDGGEIFSLLDTPGFPVEISQGAPSGEELTFSSYRAFAEPEAAPFSSQYLARRGPGGWSSASIATPREEPITTELQAQYRAFSEDLSTAWLITDAEPVLAEGGLPGYRNLYRRDNEAGTYQSQCAAMPAETSVAEFRLEPQGSSTDGAHLVFRANGGLTSGAASGSVVQLYECVDGTDLRLVSVLPGGEASAAGGSAGTAYGGMGGFGLRRSSVDGAISADGDRIFWTAATDGPGPLYVRIGGAKTIEIAPANARFRTASPAGTRVLYSVGDQLFEASVGAESATSTEIADEVEGVMGWSEDTQLIYLVSREDLDGGGGAEAGKPNLYLYRSEVGSYTFIGILSESDAREAPTGGANPPLLTPVSLFPYNRSARVTSDGLHAAFTSTAQLTGFDNTDQVSGEADAEVFLYDAEADELLCASCNPTGARPQGANVAGNSTPLWAAAKIPGWNRQDYGSRALSGDGNRLFFEAVDALALADINGVQDVYQWEAAGTGSCTEAASTYSPANGGCVDLISSGRSKQPSELVDASSDGDDVFFKTTDSLWSPDPGLTDIYDARIGGGFPEPPPPVEPCQNCQPRNPAPPDPPPASFLAPAEAAGKPPRPPRCRKGTHRVKRAGKVRCVKNRKGGKNRKTARNSRRAAR